MAFSPIGFLLSSVQAEREGVDDPQARTRLALLGGLLGGSPVASLTLTTVLARNESAGPGPASARFVRVPRLEEKGPEEAERILSSLGLRASRRNVHNKRVREGVVSNQHPDEGAIVPEGAEVKYFVSRGPDRRGTVVRQDIGQDAAGVSNDAGATDGGDGSEEPARQQEPATKT